MDLKNTHKQIRPHDIVAASSSIYKARGQSAVDTSTQNGYVLYLSRTLSVVIESPCTVVRYTTSDGPSFPLTILRESAIIYNNRRVLLQFRFDSVPSGRIGDKIAGVL